MVRFSCFNAYYHKAKKTGQLQTLEMIAKMSPSSSQDQPSTNSPNPESVNQLLFKAEGDIQTSNSGKAIISSQVEFASKSDEKKGKFDFEKNVGVHQTGYLRKTQSLGSGLYHKGTLYCGNDVEEEMDLGSSCDDSKQSPSNDFGRAPPTDYFQESFDLVNNESVFSICYPQHSRTEACDYESPSSDGCAHDASHCTPITSHVILKSYSLPNLNASKTICGGHSSFKYRPRRSRSSEDLLVLSMRKDTLVYKSGLQVLQQERDDSLCKTERNNYKNPVHDGSSSYTKVPSEKDHLKVMSEVKTGRYLHGESSVHRWDDLPSKDVKIKRIEEWVSDLQQCSPVEETNEIFQSMDQSTGEPNVNDLTAAKLDVKVGPGMDTAKRYISSLSASSTTAQLANHGLVVIPFLSSFASLKVLNLSGNAIVKITAGALPRGLHMLNLSKNSISTIEGLRELSRLRVLDLSCNKIVRIGHGLASCSSIKELHLAGNKISEVEGLHRLLKLNVLDLRFNKISTAKCLGQLAANYSSLQAISLEGNPAQKNVGDEQLRRYLQGLLPHLTSFNKPLLKVGTLKDGTDRSVRLGTSGHQFDHGLRSDHKGTRKAGSSLTSHSRLSSTHGRKTQAAMVSPKHSRGKHSRLPPTGTKPDTHHQNYLDFNSKLLNLRPHFPIPRSLSEGTLPVL